MRRFFKVIIYLGLRPLHFYRIKARLIFEKPVSYHFYDAFRIVLEQINYFLSNLHMLGSRNFLDALDIAKGQSGRRRKNDKNWLLED